MIWKEIEEREGRKERNIIYRAGEINSKRCRQKEGKVTSGK